MSLDISHLNITEGKSDTDLREQEQAARLKHHNLMEDLFDTKLVKMLDEWASAARERFKIPEEAIGNIHTIVERFVFMGERLKVFEDRFGYQIYNNAELKDMLEHTSTNGRNAPDQDRVSFIHEHGPRVWSDLILPETYTDSIANILITFAVHEAEKVGLDANRIQYIRAAAERLRFMLPRLQLFEGTLGLSDLPTKDIETFLKNNEERIEDLKKEVVNFRMGSRPEPEPFVVHTFASRQVRILNNVWLEWCRDGRSLQTLTEGQAVDLCARRSIDKLFPTHESKIGLSWQVGDTDQWRHVRDGEEPLLPLELRITRVTKTVL